MAIDPTKLSLEEKARDEGRFKHLDFAVERKGPGVFYTRFVRFLRLVLPLIAVSIVGLLMIWPNVEEAMEPLPKEAVLPQSIGKNELVNPRFESEDDKSQPFTITAGRAVQSSRDPDVIILEKPMADITLSDGSWLAAEAQYGAYRQHDEKLLLEGRVKLFHDKGYQLESEKMLVNMKTQRAWSNVPVRG